MIQFDIFKGFCIFKGSSKKFNLSIMVLEGARVGQGWLNTRLQAP